MCWCMEEYRERGRMELHLLRRAGRDEVRRMVFRRTGRGGAVPEASALQSLRRAWLQAHQDRQGPARSEEHTSELQSLMRISYAVFCLKKKNKKRRLSKAS